MQTSSLGSNTLRMSGLASGMDIDSMVDKLMKAEMMSLDKLKQDKQLLQWKKEDYREITGVVKSFKDTFLNVLNPSNNMISSSAYKQFSVESSDSSIATATANAEAQSGTHTITPTQLATEANTESSATVSASLTGASASDLDFTGANEFTITLNGNTETITLRDGAYSDYTNLVSNGTDGIQDLVDDAFGAGNITVSESSGVLTFSAPDSRITLGTGTNDALTKMGFSEGDSNKIKTSTSLENLALENSLTFNAADQLTFTINGEDFAIDKTDSLNDLMDQINSSNAGVTLSYSELTDKFTLTAKETGAGDKIEISNTGGNLFGSSSAINITDSVVSNGTDATFDLDGQTGITRSENTFTIDGVTYTLEGTGSSATVSVQQDVDSVYKNIKTFIDSYNSLIEAVNGRLDEERYRDFKPLTDSQKEQMSESEIEKWNEKAKSGLLRNDSILEDMLYDMRSAFYDSIDGVDGNLTEIGITTANYEKKGKLLIDEDKLKQAIEEQPTKVQNIFSKESDVDYDPDLLPGYRSERYNEEGIANRLYDIFQDNVRLTRNDDGQKGELIEKAGIAGDISEYYNSISSDIRETTEEINDELDMLQQKEERYYREFTAMEKAINRMNSQSQWLSQQMGGL